MSALSSQFQALVSEFETSARLRWGAYVIFALFVVWLLLLLSDERAVKESVYWRLAQDETELRELEDADVWKARFENQEKVQARLSRGLWQGNSESQVVATIQTALRKMIADAGISKSTVQVGSPLVIDAANNLSTVRIRVRGNFEGNAALDLIAQVENSQPSLVFQDLMIEVVENRLRQSRFSADIVAYLRTGDPAP